MDFKNFTFMNGWICSWCAVCLTCLYQPFMKLWVGDGLLFSFDTMVLMVLYFLIPRITSLTYTYREAAGLWWEDRFRPLVSAIVNLIINICLVKIIGMNGVIISTLLCSVFINIPWGSIVLFRNYFKRRPTEYFRDIVFYLLVTVVVSGITYMTCSLLPDGKWILLFLKAFICCIIPNVLFFLVYCRRSEYAYSKALIKRLLKNSPF